MLVLSEFLMVVCVAAVTGVLAVAFLMSSQRASMDFFEPTPDPISLLFDDGVLHHGTYAALRQFGFFPGTHVWEDLRIALLPRFPEFPRTSGTGASGSMRVLASIAQDSGMVDVSWRDGLCWVHLSEGEAQAVQLTNPQTSGADTRCSETLSHPAWETDEDDNLSWQSPAYERALRSYDSAEKRFAAITPTQNGPQRLSLSNDENETDWFEVTSHQTHAGHMHHATCITPLVQAEEAQRTFVQTLAKTFAHLSIGFAIFDRRGQLGIFNPALVDLTGLQANFLAAQPTMMSFFDALRENRMMPEPKNYATWRQDIADVILAASGGQYHETWTLEDGRTYAVQGRPHPDGATAFLIEDISADVSLSRSFRADVEQFEALLDNIEDALVVFSSAGILTFCNDAYRAMWGQNPEAAFADVTLNDAVTLWASKAHAPDGWKVITDFAATGEGKTNTSFELELSDGLILQCHLSNLTADAILVRFCPKASNPSALTLENAEAPQ